MVCNYPYCERVESPGCKACAYHRELNRLKSKLQKCRNDVQKSNDLKALIENHKKAMPSIGHKTQSPTQNVNKASTTTSVEVRNIEEVKHIEKVTQSETEIVRTITESADGTRVITEVERKRDVAHEQIVEQRRIETIKLTNNFEMIMKNDVDPRVLIERSHNAKRWLPNIHQNIYEFDKENAGLKLLAKDDPLIFKSMIKSMCINFYGFPLVQFAWSEILPIYTPDPCDFECVVTSKLIWAATHRRKDNEPNIHILSDPMDVIRQDDQDVIYIVHRVYMHMYVGDPTPVMFADVQVIVKHLNYSRHTTLTEVDGFLLKTIKNGESDLAINSAIQPLYVNCLKNDKD